MSKLPARAATPPARVLFVAEAVTLAHVARPYVLASSLNACQYDVHFAHNPRYRALFGEFPFAEHPIESVTPDDFLTALAAGKPLYDDSTLTSYVETDLKLIEQVAPDVIVGDFRLSLAVSAELAGVPYMALSNAYWSPYIVQRYTVPELPLVDRLGPRIGQWLFSAVRPFAFFQHTRPLNRVRRAYGLPGLGGNLGEVYTHADHTLYSDIPDLFRTEGLPANHHFIGPLLWSPDEPLPDWWAHLPLKRPIVYVTTGSSGNAGLLPLVMDVLAELKVTGIVSTAGGKYPDTHHDDIHVAPFLPGEQAAAVASLVICNGGSPTTHQALAAGKPVIGLAGNLDQYLNMQAVVDAGAGILLRSGRLQKGDLRQAMERVLGEASYTAAARRIATRFGDYRAPERFRRLLEQDLAG